MGWVTAKWRNRRHDGHSRNILDSWSSRLPDKSYEYTAAVSTNFHRVAIGRMAGGGAFAQVLRRMVSMHHSMCFRVSWISEFNMLALQCL